MEFALLFGTCVFLFEYYLDFRQLRKFQTATQIPKELAGNELVPVDKFEKSLDYGKDKFSFGLIQGLLMFVEGTVLLCYGYLPYAWDLATSLALTYGLFVEQSDAHSAAEASSPLRKEVAITIVFVFIMSLHDMLVGLPFSLYSTFVVEERHGFNKSTLALFLKDKLLMILLMVVIGTPVFSAMIYVIRVSGEQFYFYVWAFLCVVSILLMTVYPVYIAPLFNDYKKLDAGPVFEAIRQLAERQDVQFPLTQIYEVDGSKRSAHSNAYFFGFFKNKRIVLYDTLLEQVDIPEVQAILGHEMGHWKLWHSLQGFLITQAYTLALFLAFSTVIHNRAMFASFGFADAAARGEDMPVFIGLVIFTQTLWAPVDKILTFLVNCNSRVNEFAADEFSQQLGYGSELCSGLIKISVENLGSMVPDSWYSVYHYSHPPLVERLRAVQKLDKLAGKSPATKPTFAAPAANDKSADVSVSPAVSPKTRSKRDTKKSK